MPARSIRWGRAFRKSGYRFCEKNARNLDVRSLKRAYRLQEPGAGFPPMTAGALFEKRSNRLPARSDSPDLIDGGPDGRGYSPKGHFRQAGNVRFTGR